MKVWRRRMGLGFGKNDNCKNLEARQSLTQKRVACHPKLRRSAGWWARRELNSRPRRYEHPALTTELLARLLKINIFC